MTSLEDLPSDVFEIINKHLTVRELLDFRNISKKIKNIYDKIVKDNKYCLTYNIRKEPKYLTDNNDQLLFNLSEELNIEHTKHLLFIFPKINENIKDFIERIYDIFNIKKIDIKKAFNYLALYIVDTDFNRENTYNFMYNFNQVICMNFNKPVKNHFKISCDYITYFNCTYNPIITRNCIYARFIKCNLIDKEFLTYLNFCYIDYYDNNPIAYKFLEFIECKISELDLSNIYNLEFYGLKFNKCKIDNDRFNDYMQNYFINELNIKLCEGLINIPYISCNRLFIDDKNINLSQVYAKNFILLKNPNSDINNDSDTNLKIILRSNLYDKDHPTRNLSLYDFIRYINDNDDKNKIKLFTISWNNIMNINQNKINNNE
jgi:hypothetical protein